MRHTFGTHSVSQGRGASGAAGDAGPEQPGHSDDLRLGRTRGDGWSAAGKSRSDVERVSAVLKE
jgi:hypothetical protein